MLMRYTAARAACIMLLGCVVSCDAPEELDEPPEDLSVQDSNPVQPPDPCEVLRETQGRPETIEEVMALVDALPHPVSVECVVRALQRPIGASATNSIFSAQPAGGNESPRVFLFSGDLVISVTLGESGIHLMEFGEHLGDGNSVKGELVFPVDAPLEADAPYAHVMLNEHVSSCALCHGDETQVAEYGGARVFRSIALRPRADQVIPLESLREELTLCQTKQEESERCGLLDALFDGQLLEQGFPERFDTFF